MAGADYICCAECGVRLLYDGDRQWRIVLKELETTITCGHCVKKLKKKIKTLEKHDRRHH